MLGFIYFGLKIIFSSIIGGALNYIPDKSENNQNIIETCLICIFSASVIGFVHQYTYKQEYFTMGFGILAVVIVVNSISKNWEFGKRMMWLFSAVIGMIIGGGFLIQACLLAGLVYLISHNSTTIIDYLDKQPEEMSD